MEKKIGVIAGGPVDTQMGVDVLTAKGLTACSYPAANFAREQTEFQMQPLDMRTEKIRSLIRNAKSDGVDAMMIYCNSLSSTVDMETLSQELEIPVVTPLMAYAQYAKQYGTLAVIAGNNQGLAGIERAILASNLSATVIGLSLLPMVIEIEAGTPPEQIAEKFALKNAMNVFEHAGAEALILGCTHFPYIHQSLKPCTAMPILDPADQMYDMLVMS